ncbi:MAG: SMP-30/gluconolactonase/LRE family protein [Rhizobiaceae bacterium]|nr:SMP-30/gluconolactonase/LRE family protein [Rhizobiaceae bacterium]
MSSVVLGILKEVLFRNRDRRANPVLDGPMRPNSRLDEARVVYTAITDPDDIAFAVDGSAYVSSGRRLMKFAAGDFASTPTIVAEFDGLATALAANPAGGVVVCVAGEGLAFADGPDSGRMLRVEGGSGLKCPTATMFAPDGGLYVCDGSADNGPERWTHDLMQKRRSGRVLRIDPSTNAVEVLASGLGWPAGICLSADGSSLIVSEAWTHDVLRLPLSGRGSGWPAIAMPNLPGYPGRIIRFGGGYCLTMFALRTQLVDFVLTEDGYRNKMIERIDPAFWIAPALRSEGHYLEPVQGGGLRKHGSVKAWAPPRSYGLVAFLDDEFEPESSLHSRVGGTCHGVTGIAATGGRVYAVSKGHGKIVEIDGETLQ